MTDTETPLPELLQEEREDRSVLTRVGLVLAAGVFFVIGVVLWLTPVVTGIPFYILAMVCLGMASKRVARWINHQEEKLPYKARLWLRPKLRRKLMQQESDGPDAGEA